MENYPDFYHRNPQTYYARTLIGGGANEARVGITLQDVEYERVRNFVIGPIYERKDYSQRFAVQDICGQWWTFRVEKVQGRPYDLICFPATNKEIRAAWEKYET